MLFRSESPSTGITGAKSTVKFSVAGWERKRISEIVDSGWAPESKRRIIAFATGCVLDDATGKEGSMLTRWQQYFQESYAGTHSILEAAVEHWQFYTPVYHRMKTLLRPGSSILDIGSGYGFSDIYLSACGYDVTGVEYDQGVLQNSLAVAQQIGRASWRGRV